MEFIKPMVFISLEEYNYLQKLLESPPDILWWNEDIKKPDKKVWVFDGNDYHWAEYDPRTENWHNEFLSSIPVKMWTDFPKAPYVPKSIIDDDLPF